MPKRNRDINQKTSSAPNTNAPASDNEAQQRVNVLIFQLAAVLGRTTAIREYPAIEPRQALSMEQPAASDSDSPDPSGKRHSL